MQKVIVAGFGKNFRDYELTIRKYYEIVGFADSDINKQGQNYCGLKIINYAKLLELEYDKIIITPNKYDGIMASIVSLGIEREKIVLLVDLLSPHVDTERRLSIGFYIVGGLGDLLIATNYICSWARVYANDSCKIDILCERCADTLADICDLPENVYSILDAESVDATYYDVLFNLRRFVRVREARLESVAKYAPDMLEYIWKIKKYELMKPHIFMPSARPDYDGYIEALDAGKKRFNQSDIESLVLKGERFEIPIAIDDGLINRWNLEKRKYITIHRGCDKRNFSDKNVKLWPEENYEKLISLIKMEFSDYLVVLIGEEYERSELIRSMDINLVGKTTIKSLCAVLKYSALHIDTEGGLVHLRHTIDGGISVVLFGPTNPEFFGYSENLNVRTGACEDICELKSIDWYTSCSNKDRNCCMNSITPELIVKRIKDSKLLV